ncbi:hypothetical protein G5I_07729 [Acromyrmex echinatior]|uniref:Uncharacterized protein n=1 Tax=Acromyrmex echinatior TaxID=103372 RepID=F4WPL0_ACREC|nr:hypothetical protein G5I_07729 [Acromyrmex echinatior]
MLLREIASPDIPRCIVQSDTSETQEREFVLDRLRLIVTSKSGDVDRGRALGSRTHRMKRGIYASIDRFSRQTVNIAGPVSVDGDFRTRRRFRVLLPCDLSSGRNPLPFDVGYFSADFHPPVVLHFFSNILRIFSSYTEKVSLCDDYSLPVDFVNKRRPASAAAATSTVQWTLPSPTVENAEIEIVEQYSDPRDSKSKAYVEPGAESSLPTIYSRENRNYCRPYTGDRLFFAVDDTRRFDEIAKLPDGDSYGLETLTSSCGFEQRGNFETLARAAIKFLPWYLHEGMLWVVINPARLSRMYDTNLIRNPHRASPGVPDTRVCRLPCNTDPE